MQSRTSLEQNDLTDIDINRYPIDDQSLLWFERAERSTGKTNSCTSHTELPGIGPTRPPQDRKNPLVVKGPISPARHV